MPGFSKYLFYLLASIIILTIIACNRSFSQDIRSLLPLPDELHPWKIVDSVGIYYGNELYTLIDGGADIYIEYGFERVLSVGFENSKSQSLKLEIYEMTDASAAFGVFSLNIGKQGKPIELGDEGMQYEYYIMFWKNRFLVFASCSDMENESLVAIRMVAERVNSKIGASGKKPDIIKYLPPADLYKTVYVRGIIGLSSLYTFDTKNIFSFNEAIYGAYSSYNLFIFPYKSQKETKDVFERAKLLLQSNNKYTYAQQSTNQFTLVDQNAVQSCMTHLDNKIIIVQTKSNNNAIRFSESVIQFLKNH